MRAGSSVRESVWLLTRWSGVQLPPGPYNETVSHANRRMNRQEGVEPRQTERSEVWHRVQLPPGLLKFSRRAKLFSLGFLAPLRNNSSKTLEAKSRALTTFAPGETARFARRMLAVKICGVMQLLGNSVGFSSVW